MTKVTKVTCKPCSRRFLICSYQLDSFLNAPSNPCLSGAADAVVDQRYSFGIVLLNPKCVGWLSQTNIALAASRTQTCVCQSKTIGAEKAIWRLKRCCDLAKIASCARSLLSGCNLSTWFRKSRPGVPESICRLGVFTEEGTATSVLVYYH